VVLQQHDHWFSAVAGSSMRVRGVSVEPGGPRLYRRYVQNVGSSAGVQLHVHRLPHHHHHYDSSVTVPCRAQRALSCCWCLIVCFVHMMLFEPRVNLYALQGYAMGH
jgi:hypothetical protein